MPFGKGGFFVTAAGTPRASPSSPFSVETAFGAASIWPPECPRGLKLEGGEGVLELALDGSRIAHLVGDHRAGATTAFIDPQRDCATAVDDAAGHFFGDATQNIDAQRGLVDLAQGSHRQRWMADQLLLNHARIDVVFAADDHVLGAIEQPEPSVFINHTNVPGVGPARIAQHGLDKELLVEAGVDIPRRDARPADRQILRETHESVAGARCYRRH